MEISGPEGSIMLQLDYWLSRCWKGKPILLMDFPFSGNFKPAFDIYVDDSGNLVAKPTLKYVLQGEVQNSWDVGKCEYQKTHRISGSSEVVDDVLVIYRKDGNPKVIGLTKPVPPRVDSAHGVAVLHA
ncbi:MAG: hypothetical protein FGF48_07360, partial [Candidatus Brockarchaeota archaeon]|nr:hypothetical protein [Candidatus Brockarchaeota archaeon]